MKWWQGTWVLFALGTLTDCAPSEPPVPPPRTLVTVFEGQSTSDPGIEDMINALAAEALPDIELRWEVMGWGEQFGAQVQAKFAAGEVPDLLIGKAQDVAAYAPSGNLAALPSSLVALVQPQTIPAVTSEGLVYGMPYNSFIQGVLYNKGLFQREGLAVPTTVAQMEQIVLTLQARGLVPFASHFVENWYIGNIFMQFAIGEVLGKDPQWGDRFRSGQTSFGRSRQMAQSLSLVKLVYDHTWSDAASIDQAEADQRFQNQEAAMYVTGSWTLQNFESAPFEVGIFPFPNTNGDARLIFEPNITFMKSSQTESGDAVDRVLKVIFLNADLASRITEFTKTSSLLTVPVPGVPLLIQPDVDRFRAEGRLVDATVGNNQLVWSFQAELANHLQEWIQGRATRAEAVEWADNNRRLSAP